MKTGRTLEELFEKHIFQPLGMKRTFINVPDSANTAIMPPHAEDGSPTRPWAFKTLAGAGALYSCVSDLLKFIGANMEATSLLSSQLQKTHIAHGTGQCGLGWMQATFLDRILGNKIIWHNGRVGGYASYISIDVPHKLGIVVLSSRSTDVTFLGTMLTRKVRKHM